MNINRLSISYLRQELYLSVGLFLVILLIMRVAYVESLLTPAIISIAFTLVVSLVIALVWRRVATRSPESLPTFFTAVSGFRLLLALAVMLVYYLTSDHDSMLLFFAVFMAFYVVSLTHHSIFFARVSNRS